MVRIVGVESLRISSGAAAGLSISDTPTPLRGRSGPYASRGYSNSCSTAASKSRAILSARARLGS